MAGEDFSKQESRVIGVGGVLACSCEDRFIEEEQWVFIPDHPRRGSGCCSGGLPSFCPCFRHVSRRSSVTSATLTLQRGLVLADLQINGVTRK